MNEITYLDSWRFEAYLAGSWTNLTGYVLGRVPNKWGMTDNGPLDLLGDTGEQKLVLDNTKGVQFLPDSPGALTGWKKGVKLRLVMAFEGEDYMRFAGTVEDINPGRGIYGHQRIFVTVLDWMAYASKHPLVNPGVLTNQRGDDVIRTVVELMPIQPAAMDLDVGVSVFPTSFDTVTSKTKAYAEFAKVTLSEPGAIYLRKDRVYGETLVFENNQHWNGLKPLTTIPVPASAADLWAQEDGDLLLQEDGDTILVDEAQDFGFDDLTMDEETPYGKEVINRFTIYANPRKVDASVQVLFQLNEPILIGSGETIDIRGTYANPAGGLPVNANPDDMLTPVATTDYLMNTAQDGSGTNITGDLTLVEIRYGTEGFTHRVRNDAVNAGWITKWDPRGLGIYTDNPIEHVETDLASIASELGTQPESMTQQYQTDLIQGTLFGKRIVFEYSWPQQILTKIHFRPNNSPELMLAFLTGDVGSYFPVTVTNKNIDEHVAVRGVEFSLDPGGVIMCTWIVKVIRTLIKGLTMIAVEFAGEPSTDGINFGYLPHLADLPVRSMTAWIEPVDVAATAKADHIIGFFSDDAAFRLSWDDNNERIQFIQKYSGVGGGQGIWASPIGSVPADALSLVGVVKDLSSDSPPIFYVNGVSVSVTVIQAPPAGRTAFTETGVNFMIGNAKTATVDYDMAFGGKIEDGRLYGGEVSSTNMLALFNSGSPDPFIVTDGLLFQGPCVKTKKLADYVDETLDETLKVLDAIFGMVGVPHGAPIGREMLP